MVEFTFLELHFEDANLTANAPYSHGEKDVVADEDQPTDDDASSGNGALIALGIGLVFSVVVAYLVREKVFGGDSDAEDESIDFDE